MDWKCSYCGCICKSRRKLAEHGKNCIEKGKLSKDSLGRVKVPGIGKKSADTFRKKVESGLAEYKGHNHNEETRNRLSKIRQKWLEENPNHGVKWYTVNGIKVQGTWEKRFAEYLNRMNILWTRESIQFQKTHRYTPDFYCPVENVYFEVKGFRRDRDIYKMYLVLDEHPNIQIKMIEKEQLDNLDKINIFNLPNFQEIYKREDIDTNLFLNIWSIKTDCSPTGRRQQT